MDGGLVCGGGSDGGLGIVWEVGSFSCEYNEHGLRLVIT